MTDPKPNQVDDFHADQKHRHHCLRNCFLGCLVILVVAVVGVGYVIARAGVAQVPLFSRWYQQPVPEQRIEVPADQAEQLGQRLVGLEGQLSSGQLTIGLTEADLNHLFRQSRPDLNIRLLDDGAAEIFVPVVMPETDRTFYITIEAVPRADEGRLRLEARSLKLGQLGVPTGLLNIAVRFIQERLIDTHPLIKQITFEEVVIRDGELVLTGRFPPEALQGE